MSKHKVGTGIEQFKCGDNAAKVNSKWTNEELLLATQGMYSLEIFNSHSY